MAGMAGMSSSNFSLFEKGKAKIFFEKFEELIPAIPAKSHVEFYEESMRIS
jgi:hypothetical protein